MKTLSILFRRLVLGLLLMAAGLIVLWKSGVAVRLAARAALIASAGRVFDDPAQVAATEVAMVPGTSIRGELLKQRVSMAAALFHAGKARRLLLSGDGRSASYNEPRTMHLMLRALGVPDAAIIEDPAGLTTYDSVQHALAMSGGAAITVVSQPAHCRRAILLARGMGADAQAVIAQGGSTDTSSMTHREEYATLRAVLDLIGLRQLTSQWKKEGVKIASL